MSSKQRRPPDPVAVLRGHRGSVMDLSFHPSNHCCSPDVNEGHDTQERRSPLPGTEAAMPTWFRSTIFGSLFVSAWCGSIDLLPLDLCSYLLSVDRRAGMGRLNVGEIEGGGLPRTPSVTIKTNSYHFCKLSLVKRPQSCSTRVDGVKCHDGEDRRVRGTTDEDTLDDSRDNVERNLPEHPSAFEENTEDELSKYVTVAGEQTSEVEIWDLNTAERFARLPQS
ncbi:hypothetical protein C1H46_016509 [Malus baccata]|uniref:Uncharacterized protein n=1 Tax=Malus baccata TaxID=106549 RepID=A0A540MGY0_MALBA|nr:hypothetical protein C1H46_016509 [Malus baccata]